MDINSNILKAILVPSGKMKILLRDGSIQYDKVTLAGNDTEVRLFSIVKIRRDQRDLTMT